MIKFLPALGGKQEFTKAGRIKKETTRGSIDCYFDMSAALKGRRERVSSTGPKGEKL